VALGGFNVGVELGQLAIVGVFFPIAWLLRHTLFYRWVVVTCKEKMVIRKLFTCIMPLPKVWLKR
jgi:hypothetical protein